MVHRYILHFILNDISSVSTEVLGDRLTDPAPEPTTVDQFDDDTIKHSKAYMAEFDRVAEEELGDV